MNVTGLAVLSVLLALPDAGAEEAASFLEMDAQVAAEVARVSKEQRAADQEAERLRAHMRTTRRYAKIVPKTIRPMRVESLSRAYVEACLGLSAPRQCPGPASFFIDWLLSHEADGFDCVLGWTRAHGARDAVPDDAVPRLTSVEQALELAAASPSDADWLIAASNFAADMTARQRQFVFNRLVVFDRKNPGTLVYRLAILDPEGTCRYASNEIPHAKRARLPMHCEP